MTVRIPFILGALAALAFASPALADHHAASKGPAKQLEKAQKHKDKQADQARDEAKEHADKARGDVEETREKAEERAKKSKEQAKEQAKKAEAQGERANEGLGEEMRAQRDERKAIMGDAKSDAEPGTPRKGKKSWWRFWQSDDE